MRSALSLISLLAIAAPASAQPADYRSTIDAAVAEFAARRFPEARALFRRAHSIAPSARTHRGIGLASFEMSDYAVARRELAASLRDSRRPLSPAQRSEVGAVLDRARVFLGRYTPTLRPTETALSVDGAAATLDADGSLWLPLGRHVLTAEAPGHASIERRFETRGGEDVALDLRLTPTTASPADALDTSPPGASPAGGRAPGAAGPDPAPAIALLVVGGALGAGALGTGLAWWLGREQAIASCVEAGDMCRNGGELSDARDAAAVTTVVLALTGLASASAGGLLLAVDAGSPHAHLRCGLGAPGLSCEGTF